MSTFVTTRSGGNLYENTIVPMDFDPQERNREPAYSLTLIAKTIGEDPKAINAWKSNEKKRKARTLPWNDYRDENYLSRIFVEDFLRTKGLLEKFNWNELWKYQFGFADKVTPDTVQVQPIFEKVKAYNMTAWSDEMGFKVQKRSDWWESQIVQDIIRDKGLQYFDRINSFGWMPKVLCMSFMEYCQRLPEKDRPYHQIVDVDWDTYENGYIKFIIKDGSKIIKQTCIWCGESKLAEDYRNENGTLRSECNVCRTSSSKERRNDAIARDVHKICKTCCLDQHIQHFDGNHAECNKCRTKASSAMNKEKFDATTAIEQGRFKDCIKCGQPFDPNDPDRFQYDVGKGAYKGLCKVCRNRNEIDSESSAKRHQKGKEAQGEEYLNKNAHKKKTLLDSNPEKQAEYAVKDSYAALNAIRSRAKRESIPFIESDAAQMEEMLTKSCYVCGSPGNPFNGLDRKDRKSPYSAATTDPCCKVCNFMRLDWDLEVFLDVVSKIAKTHLQETEGEVADFTGATLGFKNASNEMHESKEWSFRKAAYQFLHIVHSTSCYLCGDPYDEKYEDNNAPPALQRPYAKSVDRVDISKNDGENCGYVVDNVLACHRMCNYIKGDRPLKAVLTHIRNIERFQRTKQAASRKDSRADDTTVKATKKLILEANKEYKRQKMDSMREHKTLPLRQLPRTGVTREMPKVLIYNFEVLVDKYASLTDFGNAIEGAVTVETFRKCAMSEPQRDQEWTFVVKIMTHNAFTSLMVSVENHLSAEQLKDAYRKFRGRSLQQTRVEWKIVKTRTSDGSSSSSPMTLTDAAKDIGITPMALKKALERHGRYNSGKFVYAQSS